MSPTRLSSPVRSFSRAFGPALAAALLLGCVPKKEYDALQAELQQTRGELDQAGQRLDERAASIRSLEEAVAAEQAQVARLEAEMAALQQAIEALRGEKAALIKDRSRLKGSVDEMQQALSELAARKAAAERRISEYKDLLSRFQALIDAGRLQVRIVDGRMVVQMATDILFASGKATLSPEGRQALAEVAGVLADIPDRRYQVEGHTDDVPIQTERFPSNWELAAARAIVVTKAMIEAGIAPQRLSAASFSEHHPVAANDAPQGRAVNRRIEIVVVPDLSQLPGFEELNALASDE